jgi:hypothetical protein
MICPSQIISLTLFLSFLSWNNVRSVAALEKITGLNTKYVKDGELFNKNGQPNVGSLKLTDVINRAE